MKIGGLREGYFHITGNLTASRVNFADGKIR
jgi:hypothetical protein